jgi:flagella basal body P-ring formation protein FlgA
MKQFLVFLFACGAWAKAACLAVDADRILVRDLAAADPAFAGASPEQVVGFSPQPGHLRLFGPQELARLAARFGILAKTFEPVCFERVTIPLTAGRLLPAIRKAVNLAEVEIAILDFSRFPLPPGELEFPRSGLSSRAPPNPDAGVIWRGRLIGTDGHGIPVWARVRLAVARHWVEAAADLPVGRPIKGTQLASRTGKQFPFSDPALAEAKDAVGRRPVRVIRAGQPILPAMLAEPGDIERGDPVSVEVSSGGAELRFDARAESSGRKGETIAVLNPISGRRFAAVVVEKGKVLVNPNATLPVGNRRSAGANNHALGERPESVQ